MTASAPRIAYLTAGAAGMYCGSCLRDNTLVVALCRQQVDATLIPTYTPIRTDESDASVDHVFFGGINVYLQQRFPLIRWLPSFFDRWLDNPRLIRWVARDPSAPDLEFLGEMTLSMLRGDAGRQAKEVDKLCQWLKLDLRPSLVNFSNLLIGGCIPTLKRELRVPIVATLQGDDVFLESLPPKYRNQSIDLIRGLAKHVDAFIVFNRYYADFTSEYFEIPRDKIHVVPLGINLKDFAEFEGRQPRSAGNPTIGYLSRLDPAKGLHRLVDAFIDLKQRPAPGADAKLLIAGWLGKDHQAYADQQFRRLEQAGLGTEFEYRGTVDRAGKLKFLHDVDLLSVPTEYRDPKGIYILEALAAGVPFVQPAHGGFPELHESTQGGELVTPLDQNSLVEAWIAMLSAPDRLHQLGQSGRAEVLQRHSDTAMAQATLDVYQSLL